MTRAAALPSERLDLRHQEKKMIRHIVMFRRKADVPYDAQLEGSLFSEMQGLGNRIPHLLRMELRKNEVNRPISWDYVAESSVEDLAALDAYLEHPAHRIIVAKISPYFEVAAVDYSHR